MLECFDYVRGTPLMLIDCMTALGSFLHKGIQSFHRQFPDHKIKLGGVLLNFTDLFYHHR